jgi:DNA-binding NarL/FixJ family response regulator
MRNALQNRRVHSVPYISSTTVRLGLARRQRAKPIPPTPDAQEAHEAPLSMQPLRTYIVEDSQVIRENLIATLEELVPVEVVGTAEDESTAVHWLARPSNHADLLIVDIFLKAGSGLGVLRAASALAQRRHVVVLSNYATPDMRRKCLELGADQVFDKSNEIDALIQYCGRLANGGDAHSAHGALT